MHPPHPPQHAQVFAHGFLQKHTIDDIRSMVRAYHAGMNKGDFNQFRYPCSCRGGIVWIEGWNQWLGCSSRSRRLYYCLIDRCVIRGVRIDWNGQFCQWTLVVAVGMDLGSVPHRASGSHQAVCRCRSSCCEGRNHGGRRPTLTTKATRATVSPKGTDTPEQATAAAFVEPRMRLEQPHNNYNRIANEQNLH